MAAEIGAYAFEDVLVLIDGVPITGWADGDDVISVARDVDTYSKLVGAAGDVALLKNADRSGVATLRLLQTSNANKILTAKVKLQDSGVISPFPFSVKDLNGDDLVLAEQAVVKVVPEMRFGTGHNEREWQLLLPAVDIFALGAGS